jgi:hypothetical protein
MTTADFASNGKFRTAIYGSALPGAVLKAGADVLRRAVIALSTPAIRRMTTATGWAPDRTRFLVPGGYVDADGYHDDDPAPGIPQVDLGASDPSMVLPRLDAAALVGTSRVSCGLVRWPCRASPSDVDLARSAGRSNDRSGKPRSYVLAASVVRRH